MQIKFVVLSPRHHAVDAELGREPIADACYAFATDPSFTRIAFGGRTTRGRGGVTLTVRDGDLEVRGHKLEPISEVLRQEAVFFGAHDVRDALQEFARGVSVCIRANSGDSLLLRWDPIAPEVYAVGDDSSR